MNIAAPAVPSPMVTALLTPSTTATAPCAVVRRFPGMSYLAGWVLPEREAEATAWIDFLNREIRARLAAAGHDAGGVPPASRDLSAAEIDGDQHLQQSVALFRCLGVPVPEAATMDDFMTKLEEMSQADGPIDSLEGPGAPGRRRRRWVMLRG